ncbi:MAG: YaaR family protein [Thermoanaerobacteraceae bacterium]|nr:YaaR family protein [Thermoanaerobacteraceae bacterium]
MRVNLSTNYHLQSDVIIHQEQGQPSFSEHLRVAENSQLKQTIDMELDTISEIGRRLVKSMSLADFKEFRQRIGNFLKMCISQGFSFEEERLGSRFGRTKILAIVKTVNQKLVDLGKELISKNRDSLKVLALVDEIRGILLDFYA